MHGGLIYVYKLNLSCFISLINKYSSTISNMFSYNYNSSSTYIPIIIIAIMCSCWVTPTSRLLLPNLHNKILDEQ